jgi:hypothetical protein
MFLCSLALVALVGLLAAACADDTGGGADTAPAATPAPGLTPTPPAGSMPPSGPTMTLVGEVKAGVEAGCLVLEAERGGGVWLLLGGDPSVLRAGARVQVTGSEARGVATTCQQGRPFQVSSARPA